MHTQASHLPAAARPDEVAAAPKPLTGQDMIAAAATERALRELLELLPDDAIPHHQYAQFLAAQQRTDDAAAHFRRALELQPDFPEALRDLARLRSAQREFSDAVRLLRRAVAIRPDDLPALCDLGNALVNLKCGGEAVPIFQHALRLAPEDHRLYSNLGLAYTEAGAFEEAEKAFLEALRCRPAFASAHINLGVLYLLLNRCDEACACFDRAEALAPDNLNAKCNRALALLSMGDYQRGWRHYQARWDRPATPHRVYPQPLWTGAPLDARRILLYTDEGLGDRIQFIRYAALLKARGAQVICECPMPLLDVFRGIDGVAELVALGGPLPPFDFHAPLLSLPHLFNTTLASVPAHVPYLTADRARTLAWRQRLGESAAPGTFLIGLAWQGNPHHQWDRFRSMPLRHLAPLADIAAVRLVSLQRGPGIEQIDDFQRLTGDCMMVPTDGQQAAPADLADTVAIMSCLDLVITVDTATAHLAGALARRVWVALSTVTDWRWMADRADSPWYPTMRLFRQKHLGDWAELVARLVACVSAALRDPCKGP